MKALTLAEIATLTSSDLVGNPSYLIEGVGELEEATSQEVSFLENPRYAGKMKESQAGAFFIHPTTPRQEGKNYLLHKHPSLAFQKLILHFLPPKKSGFEGIHPTAIIHPEATIGADCTIGPYVVIDRKVTIGEHTHIEAGTTIGAESQIGTHCHIYSKVVVREGVIIGNRVILQPGAVIGSCGFGYFTDEKGKHHPLEQRGCVIIEDDVEIGANTTIDRARFKTTKIGRGTKIDNLVQIAHQVSLGPDNLIVSQVGIAGSTKTGRNVVIGGQTGVVGHISIGDRVMLAARSGVHKSMLEPGVYGGSPAVPIKEFGEQTILLKNIKKIADRLKKLEETLKV